MLLATAPDVNNRRPRQEKIGGMTLRNPGTIEALAFPSEG